MMYVPRISTKLALLIVDFIATMIMIIPGVKTK